ncbi:MAG: Ribose-phosphate pyrophosphokinase [Microgenomates group bacterium GW2011_GWF2_45_18]|nr:MAG: Ribose-phosphate pyrophosphokinase [Microgenomates group bacterium GW2011_GWF1_44_10]KKU02002.1 MAG: Ribose-phosphate pyrophosphokinase [Microgenomates group bacterium GW2011_GWF2_45_18]HAU99012.1 hypothetical protein [Candidatus Paceibacterota bacterium]HAX01274.1 hypothetical protein [Candidatus Paceibacterota bacterium]
MSMTVYTGSSNYPFANEYAKHHGLSVGNIEISRFENSELRVRVLDEAVDSQVTLIQSLSHPTNDHLVEFCLIADALKRAGAKQIQAIIPYLGYSKQDKVFRAGEPLSVKVIANILQTAPIDRITTFDLHNPSIVGFFDIPLVNVYARPAFLEYFRPTVGARSIVVAPDAGSMKNSTQFAMELGLQVAYIDKKRDLATGKVEIIGMSREVEGSDCILIDDMISTGSTLIEVSRFLKSRGARSVRIGVTHHLYIDGVQEKIEASEIDELVVSNTISRKVDGEKLKEISVVGLM